MNKDFHELLKDSDIGDEVKVSLLPQMLEAELNSQKNSVSGWQKLLKSGPIIAALASIFTVGITELSKGYLSSTDKAHEQNLEKQKFQYEIIRIALQEGESKEKRASLLKFFTEIELLDGLNSGALDRWAEPDVVPSIRSNRESPNARKIRLYVETIQLINDIVVNGGRVDLNPNSHKRFWELYRYELDGIMSPSVAQSMERFGLLIKPKGDDEISKEGLKRTGQVLIDKMMGVIQRIAVLEGIRIDPLILDQLFRIDAG